MALILFCYSVGREVMKDIGAVINLLAELKENTIKIMKTRVCFVYTELEVSVDISPFFYNLALLLLFGLATLILMMIQIQALAD